MVFTRAVFTEAILLVCVEFIYIICVEYIISKYSWHSLSKLCFYGYYLIYLNIPGTVCPSCVSVVIIYYI